MNCYDESIERVKKVNIQHRNWLKAIDEVYSAITSSMDGEVVTIIGPSRAGKSRLIKELSKLLVAPDFDAREGTMPCVSVLAKNCNNNGHFSSKFFILNALKALEHPYYGITDLRDPFGTEMSKLIGKTSEQVLYDAFERALEFRRTKFFFVDEVQHVLRILGGDKAAAAFFDSLKALAQDKNMILILVGAYPLLNVLELSPHLLGREQQVHLPRYNATIEDINAFNHILASYSQFIKLPKGIDSLVEWNEILYSGSLGCIGLLNRWLRSALGKAKSEGSPYLKKEHLLKSMKSKKTLSVLATEIIKGEKALQVDIELFNECDIELTEVNKRKARKHKPYQKKPRRYSIKKVEKEAEVEV